MPIFPTVNTLWLAWKGVLLLRKTPAQERTPPRQTATDLAAPNTPAAKPHPER